MMLILMLMLMMMALANRTVMPSEERPLLVGPNLI